MNNKIKLASYLTILIAASPDTNAGIWDSLIGSNKSSNTPTAAPAAANSGRATKPAPTGGNAGPLVSPTVTPGTAEPDHAKQSSLFESLSGSRTNQPAAAANSGRATKPAPTGGSAGPLVSPTVTPGTADPDHAKQSSLFESLSGSRTNQPAAAANSGRATKPAPTGGSAGPLVSPTVTPGTADPDLARQSSLFESLSGSRTNQPAAAANSGGGATKPAPTGGSAGPLVSPTVTPGTADPDLARQSSLFESLSGSRTNQPAASANSGGGATKPFPTGNTGPLVSPTVTPGTADPDLARQSSLFESLSGSRTNQPATATNSGEAAQPSAQHQSDYNKYFDTVPAGTVVEVGGGTVTKNADGSATYRNSSGVTYTYTKNTPIADVARNAPGMGASWGQAYNYQAPAASASTSTPSNLQRDYNKYFDTVPAGTVVEVGGGTVTRNADGSATYRNSSGHTYTYTKNTPIDEVAKNAPGLGVSWNRSYGYQAPAEKLPFNSYEEYVAWEKNLKLNAKFNPNYKVPDYIRIALMDTGPESAYGRYLFMKNNPQYAKDYENIHNGKLSTQTTDGTTIIKSRVENMPPEIAKYYRENPAALLASEGFGTDPVLARMLYTGEIKLPNNINKTEWLRQHAWTPNGIIEQNNPLAYSAAGYRGLNGDGGYLINRIDPATGKVIDTPQWEGSPGLESDEDHGGAVVGVHLSNDSSSAATKSGAVTPASGSSAPVTGGVYPRPAEPVTGGVYPRPAEPVTGGVYPRPAEPVTGGVYPQPNNSELNQSSSMYKNNIILNGVVHAENPNLLKPATGDKSESYSATMIAQNSMFGASALAAADKFQSKLAESIINKCNSNSHAKENGLDGSYQLYSQSCIIYELVTSSAGIFKEMDELEKQIIEDQKALTQAGKEFNDRDAKIKEQKKKIEETNAKIKAAITELKSAKEAQKKAQAAVSKAQAELTSANAITCSEEDDGSCASSKAKAIENATKALEQAQKELTEAEKKLTAATTKIINLLVDKYGNETAAVMSLLSGTIRGETSAGNVQFQVAGDDFSLIDLDSEIEKLTGTTAERASQLIGGEVNEATLDYFQKLINNYEGSSSTDEGNSSGQAASLSGPKGEVLSEVLDVFAAMENGESYLENIALAVTEYSSNEGKKQIELLEQMKTPEGRAGQAANQIEEKKKLLENYKQMNLQLLKTLDQNLKLFKSFYAATKESSTEEDSKVAQEAYYEYLSKFTTADLKTKLTEGYFSKVDYIKIQKTHQCLNDGGSSSCK